LKQCSFGTKSQMKIGIDIGNVLCSFKAPPLANTPFNTTYSNEALDYLSTEHELNIISKCSLNRAIKNIENMSQFNKLGLFRELYYVADKLDKSKVIKHIGCNVMIDDNEEILNNIKLNTPQTITILYQEFNKQQKKQSRKHHLASDWHMVIDIINNLDPIGYIHEPLSLGFQTLGDNSYYLITEPEEEL